MGPKVTVVITTRNRPGLLREAVASVLRQDGVAHELIVVDNGSDAADDFLVALDAAGVKTLRVPHDPHRSRASNTSRARNAGLECAAGEHVWFLDDDDRLMSGSLAVMAEALDRQPRAIAAIGARTRFQQDRSLGRISHPLRRVVGDRGSDLLLGWAFIAGQTLCPASALRQAGGWREDVTHSEDLDLWARLLPLGPIVLVPETVLEYRVHRVKPRLADPVGERDLLLRPHLARLAGGRLAHGRTLRRAGRCWERAMRADELGEHGRALGWTLRAAFLAPRLLWSPVTSPLALRVLARGVSGLLVPARRSDR